MVPIPKTIQEKTVAALQGDTHAFGTSFQWYRPRLQAHAFRLCGNTPLAHDVVQETFLSAFLNYKSLRDASFFYPWLKKILTNHCYRQLQKQKNHSQPEDVIEKKDNLIQRSIEEKFEKTANNQLMYAALNQLSNELRSCVMLRYFTNFKSYESIAKILDIPVGTVRSRLAAARVKLFELSRLITDPEDKAMNESMKWSNYYTHLWKNLYDEYWARNEFIDHMHPLLNIRFTSGKPGRGRSIIAKMFEEDLAHGSQLKVHEVASSSDVTVIEGFNFNSPEFPEHCPASSVMVLFRNRQKVETCHIFDSPRDHS
jgi:RNA polymerase sigma factor (sigma-70 family)